ncbi:MAG: KH domain-containing protein [Halobacteriales archaeon]|nr:KH domain-containing protein [Halobacteriales archaeon]
MTVEGVRIPARRVGVLIGHEGATKRELEERTGVQLVIDSETGDVQFRDVKGFDPVLGLKLRDIVRAVGRGFPAEMALRLLQDETYLEVLDLQDYVGKRPNHIERVRSRLIGTHGKTRIIIEETTGANMRIEGDTVGILGDIHEVALAKEAVEMIIEGAPHSAVYKMLERKRKELRLHDMGVR